MEATPLLKLAKPIPRIGNYYTALLQYAAGRSTIQVNCRGRVIGLDRDTFKYFAALHAYGLIKDIDCERGLIHIVNGDVLPFSELMESDHHYAAFLAGWRYNHVDGYWYRGGVRFIHMYWPIVDNFDNGIYDVVDFKGRVVLDVGAFVGDTPILFVLKGAKLVYAVEPSLRNFNEMAKNIELNGMGNAIIPLRLLIAYRPAKLTVAKTARERSVVKATGGEGEGAPVATLSSILDMLPTPPDILKLDCEGCEFDIADYDYGAFSRFSELIIEYHSYITHRPPSDLARRLIREFDCRLVKVPYRNPAREGVLHCRRLP